MGKQLDAGRGHRAQDTARAHAQPPHWCENAPVHHLGCCKQVVILQYRRTFSTVDARSAITHLLPMMLRPCSCRHTANRRAVVLAYLKHTGLLHRPSQWSCPVQKPGATVLVAGATGGVGQIAVAKLLDRGFSVRVLTRDAAKAQELFSGKVDVVSADLKDEAALLEAAVFEGCSAAIVAIGTTAFPSKRCAPPRL